MPHEATTILLNNTQTKNKGNEIKKKLDETTQGNEKRKVMGDGGAMDNKREEKKASTKKEGRQTWWIRDGRDNGADAPHLCLSVTTSN